jgi:hypothetical protein
VRSNPFTSPVVSRKVAGLRTREAVDPHHPSPRGLCSARTAAHDAAILRQESAQRATREGLTDLCAALWEP